MEILESEKKDTIFLFNTRPLQVQKVAIAARTVVYSLRCSALQNVDESSVTIHLDEVPGANDSRC